MLGIAVPEIPAVPDSAAPVMQVEPRATIGHIDCAKALTGLIMMLMSGQVHGRTLSCPAESAATPTFILACLLTMIIVFMCGVAAGWISHSMLARADRGSSVALSPSAPLAPSAAVLGAVPVQEYVPPVLHAQAVQAGFQSRIYQLMVWGSSKVN